MVITPKSQEHSTGRSGSEQKIRMLNTEKKLSDAAGLHGVWRCCFWLFVAVQIGGKMHGTKNAWKI